MWALLLTKGIICSLATVLLLMPALILRFSDKIESTRHKRLMPSFSKFARAMHQIRWPVLVLCLALAVPCYFGQGMNTFFYGDDALGASPGTSYYDDTQEINAMFGKSNVVLAIVPNTSVVQERELTDTLDGLDFTITRCPCRHPAGRHSKLLPADAVKMLHTENYSAGF